MKHSKAYGTAIGPALRRAGVWLAALVLLVAGAVAQDADDNRQLLDSIRDDLVQMHFDEALAGIEALLGRPGMTQAERAEALILRAQAHAAFGDFDAVEKDYRAILGIRPAYVPDRSLTPAKAMERYNKVKAEMIGRIKIELDPADARLFVDGVEVAPDPTGLVMVLAGPHTLRAERNGHDPLEQVVDVAANKEEPLLLELMPNARTVVLRTDETGVSVKIDGEPVGETARPSEAVGAGAPAAELVIEDVPLGEHIFELTKECFTPQLLSDTLAVDLLNKTPKRYEVVRMTPARSRVTLRGGPDRAEVLVDGTKVGRLPATTLETCPGVRTLAVTLGGRVIWQQTVEMDEGRELALDVEPRPNLVFVGTEQWPTELAELGRTFNLVGRLDHPRDAELGSRDGWTALRFPPEVDLAFGVVPARRQGAADRWYLYSPILREVMQIEAVPPGLERPEWSTVTWGFAVVDTAVGGTLRVVRVIEGGPAAKAGLAVGDRIVEVAGRKVEDAHQAEATLKLARPDKPVRLKWVGAKGEAAEADLIGNLSPLLVSRHERLDVAMVRAAWAELDANIADPRVVASALANLGLLFLEHGHFELAVDIWRRVDWGARAGIGEGTKQYYLGRALEGEGREDDAVAAYRKAAASASTAFTDDGLPIALAARDRLADLGVSN
jgi:hypothetical protein